ncbi:MAG: hypothetical protein HYX94_01175 [Chloroflexi bacterium]|nr:hypothetical protein [Chloroflexota bacterium]
MEQANSVDEFLTLEQAERRYAVKRSTLYRYIGKGYLSTYRRAMDKRAYVKAADIEALRRFRQTVAVGGVTLAAVERARDFQRRVFGERQFSTSSAELIEKGRRERDEELP